MTYKKNETYVFLKKNTNNSNINDCFMTILMKFEVFFLRLERQALTK